jgi:PhnB protein
MRLNPHLTFDGRCEEAFRFYVGVLQGRIVSMLPYRVSPLADRVPAEWRDRILHATLDLGEGRLTGADVSSDQGYRTPDGFSVLLEPEDAAEAERIFARLSEGGRVGMPLQQTFWAERFGMVTDRFGIPWMLNCATP